MQDRVFKKIHKDGSETVIKQVRSAFRDSGGVYQEREETVTSIFISSSSGCPYKCVFCHLTEMQMKHTRLSAAAIVENVLEAVSDCDFFEPHKEHRETYKLCFMGMGDPCVDTAKTAKVAMALVECLRVNEVDISTVNPKYLYELMELRERVKVRLFYSLHTSLSTRKHIIPYAQLSQIQSRELQQWTGDLFIHYTPIKDLNDGLLDALSIAKFAKRVRAKQVRMLEFNPYSDSVYERPSQEQLSKLYKVFNKSNVDVKWQVSKGKEELAACGMFNEVDK